MNRLERDVKRHLFDSKRLLYIPRPQWVKESLFPSLCTSLEVLR